MATPNGKKLKQRVITIVILAIVIFMITVLAGYPQLIERYYSQGLYPFICIVVHPVFNLLPFSLGDVFYIVATGGIIYGVVQIIRLFFKKQFKRGINTLLGFAISVQAAIIIFYLFWGMNYFRPPAAERLHLQDTVYSLNQLKAVTVLLIDSANATRSRLTPADLKLKNTDIYKIAEGAVNSLSARSANFRTHSPGVKPSLLTPIINYLGTSGYYNPFTTEAQINYQMPVFIKPFVACHELSHQIGFGPEDEANFAGYLAGINSKNRLLRYSAYYAGMTEFMYALRATDSVAFKQYKKQIAKNVLTDLKTEHAYWQYYEGRLE
ncbi:MAG: DUF3810 domain-containing protein, partial [Sphingobacteriaceae bacterium]